MGKKLTTLLALALTACLALLAPHLTRPSQAPAQGFRITRVWAVDCDPALIAWLKKQAAAYEKAADARVYLRVATLDEAAAAQAGQSDAVAPDLLIWEESGAPVAALGYALVLRDDGVSPVTPAPTSALFFRPTSTPGPTATPAPTPDPQSLSAVLVPDGLAVSLPGARISRDPAADFIAGKAPAALLTAGQAAALPFGYRAYPPPAPAFRLWRTLALSPDGDALLSSLLSPASQRALAAHGLYSVQPDLTLYDAVSDPLRAMIEETTRQGGLLALPEPTPQGSSSLDPLGGKI